MNAKHQRCRESTEFEHKNSCLILNKLGWEPEQAKMLALHAPVVYSPRDLFFPAEFSFDTEGHELGVFYATNYLDPSAPVLRSVCSWLATTCPRDLPLDLFKFLIEAYDGLMGKNVVRFGCGVKKDARTAYFEGIPNFALRRLLKYLGAETSYPLTEGALLKMGKHILPEGVGVCLAGAAPGKVKIYAPVRNSDPERFYHCMSEICGNEWGDALRDTLRLVVGSRDVYQSGRLILGFTAGDTRPGIAIYLKNLLPSDACTLLLAHFIGKRLDINTESLNRFAIEFAPAFKWTNTSNIAFLTVEPGREGHSRLRLWLRPAVRKV